MTDRNLGDIYSRRSNEFGPKTYSDQAFTEKIASAIKLRSLPSNARVLDAMSGPGKLAEMLKTQVPNAPANFHFIDLSPSQLQKITEGDRVTGDVRHLPYRPESFDIVYARYAIKDLPAEDQLIAMKELVSSIKGGGAFVLIDMYVQNTVVLDWLNRQHSMKQEFSGRDIKRDGHCNIRTMQGWIEMLNSSGLSIEAVYMHLSQVTTTDWLKSNQVSEEQLQMLDEYILSAPPDVIKAFSIRSVDGMVMIDYPTCIIRGEKI